MSISIGSDSLFAATQGVNSSKTDNLKKTLENNASTDKELMEACKDFEAYLLEQVYKGMQKTVLKNEEEQNDYMALFGDMQYGKYAENATEGEGLGIAQILYESMKRNS